MTSMLKLFFCLLVFAATLDRPTLARAQTMDCFVKDPKPPLNVRKEAKGEIVGTLNNGTRLFVQTWTWGDPKWLNAGIVSDGQWKNLGYVFRSLLDCSETDTSHRYPFVITNPPDLKKFGLALRDYGKNGRDVVPFNNKCFYYGDGGYTLSISDDFRKRYAAKGIAFDNMCAVLRSDGLRYDPDTGTRLATYIIGDLDELRTAAAYEPGTVTGELPLEIPACFKTGIVKFGAAHAGLTRSGCSYRYHPWSGRPLGPAEAAYFSKFPIELEGGAAPGTSPDAAKAALDPRLIASSTQIEAEDKKLRSRASMGNDRQ
jgi:hypothetical protein